MNAASDLAIRGAVRRHPVRTGLIALVTLVLVVVGVGYREPLWLIDQVVRLHLWRAGVESRYVTVDGERIHYLEARPAGAESGLPMVLVHGLGARSEDWSPMLTGLAKQGFHVYALDLLGYGRSARPGDASYSIAQEESVVGGFMRALGLPRADVAGWSMGGWVAMKLAMDEPAMVNRLVLFDSAGVYFPIESPETLFAPETPAQFRQLMAKLTPVHMPDFFVADGVRRLRRNRWVIQRSLSAMKSGADLMDFRLTQIRQPTLIVWGADDTLIPPSVGEQLHRGIAGSSLTLLEGCGHLAPAQCARPAMAATVDFLRSGSKVREGAQHRAVALR